MNKFGKCLQTFLVAYNLLTLLAGIAAIAVSVWLIIGRYFMENLIGLHMFIGLLYLMLIIAIFVVKISFFGFFGAANKIRWMLYVYGVFLSVLFMVVFLTAILGLLIREQVAKSIQESLLHSINLYSENSDVRQAWDETQPYFKCCGVSSYKDWNGYIPKSCCEVLSFDFDPKCDLSSDPPRAIYTKGCYSLLEGFISTNLMYICVAGLFAGFLKIIGIMSSFALALILYHEEVLHEEMTDKRNGWRNRFAYD